MPRKSGKRRVRGCRSRGWSITVNNYDAEDEQKIQDIPCEYLVYGREVAPTTGTRHLQLYVHFTNAREFESVRVMFPRSAHIEKSKGSPQENREYCIKDGDVFESGTIPRQGRRTDYVDMQRMALSGVPYSKIIETCTSLVAVRGVEALMKYDHRALNERKKITSAWLWGSTGVGKSTQCRDWIHAQGYDDSFWVSQHDLKWFDGYIDQKVCLFDDLRLENVDWSFFLTLFDGWKKRVPVKNGHTWFYPDYILVTAPLHPASYAPPREDPKQLTRRLTKIVHLTRREGQQEETIDNEEEIEV